MKKFKIKKDLKKDKKEEIKDEKAKLDLKKPSISDNWKIYESENKVEDENDENIELIANKLIINDDTSGPETNYNKLLEQSAQFSKYAFTGDVEEKKKKSGVFDLDMRKLDYALKSECFNEYFPELDQQLYFNEEHLKHFQRNAEENALIFDSLYAKKEIPNIVQNKQLEPKEDIKKEDNPKETVKVEVEDSKVELVKEANTESVKETKPVVQNTNIDDWLDDLIN